MCPPHERDCKLNLNPHTQAAHLPITRTSFLVQCMHSADLEKVNYDKSQCVVQKTAVHRVTAASHCLLIDTNFKQNNVRDGLNALRAQSWPGGTQYSTFQCRMLVG